MAGKNWEKSNFLSIEFLTVNSKNNQSLISEKAWNVFILSHHKLQSDLKNLRGGEMWALFR